jgi:polysaccharide export outer membrane protein
MHCGFVNWLVPCVLISSVGCQSLYHVHQAPGHTMPVAAPATPRELSKVVLPSYRIEPPDILNIEAVRLIPKSPYTLNTVDLLRIRIQRASIDRVVPSDILVIRVPGAPAIAPIDGEFLVQPSGHISLGPPYGSVLVMGLTLDQAEAEVEKHLDRTLVAPETILSLGESGMPADGEYSIEVDGTVDFIHPYGRVPLTGLTIGEARERLKEHFSEFFDEPAVSVNLLQTGLQQQITGEHLVGPDGTVTLGMYGSVSVINMTVNQARAAIEYHLSQFLNEPKVAVSVFSFNSKVYYVIAQGAGFGDQIFRFPITGGETVLDALAQIQGLPEVSSSRMWIARPSPMEEEYQVLPIAWNKIASLGSTGTNYQLLPGDRLYVAQDNFVAFDRMLSKATAPIERLMGFSILGASTATRLSGRVLAGGGNPFTRF